MVKCPDCSVEYEEAEMDFGYQGIVWGVKCLRCPKCGDELFTPEQYDAIRARGSALVQP